MRQFDEIVKLDKSMDEAYRAISRPQPKQEKGMLYAKAESQMKDLGIDCYTKMLC